MSRLLPTLLAAGRTPLCWQRETAGHKARLDSLWRACAWVKAMAVTRIRLRDTPLFGHCLAEQVAEATSLTSGEPTATRLLQTRGTRPGEPTTTRPSRTWPAEPGEPATTRSLRNRATPPVEQAEHRQLFSSAVPNPEARFPMPGPFHSDQKKSTPERLSGQASLALLSRLAGVTPSVRRKLPHRSPVGPSWPGQRDILNFQSPGLAEAAAGSLDLAQEHFFRWQEQLDRRVGHLLRRAGLPLAGLAEPEAASSAWSRPVAGVTVPGELLVQLAGQPQRAERRVRYNGVPPAAPPVALDDPFASPGTAQDGRQPVAPLSRRQPGPIARSAEPAGSRRRVLRSPAIGETLSPGRPAAGVVGQILENSAVLRGAAGWIAPPTIAPQMPPLIPAPTVDPPTLPFAAIAAQQGAGAEALADEDLEALAAKIKRILDEEARRHGIDV